METIFEKIRAIIMEQLDKKEEEVKLSSNIQDDLGADSLDVVDLVMAFEDEFEIEVPDDLVEKAKTVEDIVKYIESVTDVEG